MVSIHIAACYVIIYFLLPRFLLRGKYFLLLIGIIMLGGAMILASRFIDTILIPFITQINDYAKTPYFASIFSGVITAIKVFAVATAIKLGKHWWKKQKEKEQLEREKINAELQLLKAQIQPAFLFNVLDNIYAYSLAASPVAPQLLIKLSDLLSYMLYECDQTFVSLKKEIDMMKQYIALEKIRLNDGTEMELSVMGYMDNKMIAPFLLLPFIENSFKQSSDLIEQPWINMDISVEGDSFTMKLANGMSPENNGVQAPSYNGLANVQKRLYLLYPEKHDLKITREPEMLVVLLKIHLTEKNISDNIKEEEHVVSDPAFTQPNVYAAQ
jgi:sensor histidine kinase YesM